MQKIATPQDLQAELRRLLAYCQDTPSREYLASEIRELADRVANEDNSWGRGYYPLPHQLAGLGRFVDSLRPNNLTDHKVFPDEGTHMLTIKVTPKLSIMSADMRSLLKLGLSRVQSNTPGTLSFYFAGYPSGPQAPHV